MTVRFPEPIRPSRRVWPVWSIEPVQVGPGATRARAGHVGDVVAARDVEPDVGAEVQPDGHRIQQRPIVRRLLEPDAVRARDHVVGEQHRRGRPVGERDERRVRVRRADHGHVGRGEGPVRGDERTGVGMQAQVVVRVARDADPVDGGVEVEPIRSPFNAAGADSKAGPSASAIAVRGLIR